jgi:hypothetical protein
VVGNSAHETSCRYHTARLPSYQGGGVDEVDEVDDSEEVDP